MANIVIEIDGVKHKLIEPANKEDKTNELCKKCSINHLCFYHDMDGDSICTVLGGELNSRFEQI